MKTSLRTLALASLLGLAAFAITPVQGQTTNTDSLVIAPKNSAVKVIDSSSANGLNITMVGSPTPAQKNTAARDNRADKIDTTVLNQKVKPEKLSPNTKAAGKKVGKVTEQQKKTSTQTVR